MKTNIQRSLSMAVLLIACIGVVSQAAAAADYTATTMRLLHHEGSVEIEDASGKPRTVMDNARFSSGEAMRTGEESSASVGLDAAKIVTLDSLSRVEFSKQADSMKMNLTEGTLLLDVRKKLRDEETLDIQTSTMAVGIRGTIVFVSDLSASDADSQASGSSGGQSGSDAEGGRAKAGESAGRQQQAAAEGNADGQHQAVDAAALTEVLTPGAEGTAEGRVSRLGVLEGTAQLSYVDPNGVARILSVSAGNKATLADTDLDGRVDEAPVVTPVTGEDIRGFVEKQMEADPDLKERVEKAGGVTDTVPEAEAQDHGYTADGNWTYTGTVTLVAQSASKLYDGQPLTRSGDVLVNGLPEGFSIQVAAGGSQTDAGRGTNPISRYTIYNGAGEDVTGHFTNIETVNGVLVVDPAPLTVWTGSAVKTYDGTALTSTDTGVTGAGGYVMNQAPWRNTSYILSETDHRQPFSEGETLYGVSGVIRVHGTNPLTGETKEIDLYAGQKLTVHLHDEEGGGQSIEFLVETVSVEELPEKVLRLYAENPELTAQACADTGWDPVLLAQRIAQLPEREAGEKTVEQNGLTVGQDETDNLMKDLTNVRITIDTEITNYNNRALGSEEAHYTGVRIEDSIKVTATGRQTDVGESENSYTIDWGSADPGNYILQEQKGTLTVTPAPVKVTTGSAAKTYDGTPLTDAEASITGLVNGETATVTATGSITNRGSADNTYSLRWGTARESNYTLSEDLGTLRVHANDTPIRFTAVTTSKSYDGTPLTGSSAVTIKSETAETLQISSLPDGFSFHADVSGSQTDAGSSEYEITSFQVLNAEGEDVTENFSNISTEKGTLTVEPAKATVRTGSASKGYDGTPLTGSEASITGLVNGETATVTATGTITEVGTAENTYSITWGTAKEGNYVLAEETGTLEVTKNSTEITFTAGSATKTYDGTALTADSVTASGVPAGLTWTAEASGSRTDVGTAASTVASYKIADAGENDVTAFFTNIKTEDGTLTVTKNNTEITLTSASAEKTYDGTPLTANEVTVEGLPAGFTYKASASGWMGLSPDVGTYTNAFDDMPYTFEDEDGNVLSGWRYYEIDNADGDDVTDWFTNVKLVKGTLTVKPAPATILTDSASKTFDGTALTAGEASITGLADGETATVTATGTITDAGKVQNTCTVSWETAKETNYSVTEDLGTLEVTPLKAAFDMNCYEADFCGMYFVPDGINGTYEDGSEVEQEDLHFETDSYGQPVQVTGVFNLTGGGKVRLQSDGIYDAGTYEIVPDIAFTAGKAGNYELSFTNNEMKVNEMVVTFLYGTLPGNPIEYDGNWHGGNVRGVNLGGAEFSLYKDSDSEWTIEGYSPYPNEKIHIKVDGGGTESGTYTLKCTCSFDNDPDNYILNIDDEETLTIGEVVISEPEGGAIPSEEVNSDPAGSVEGPGVGETSGKPDAAGAGDESGEGTDAQSGDTPGKNAGAGEKNGLPEDAKAADPGSGDSGSGNTEDKEAEAQDSGSRNTEDKEPAVKNSEAGNKEEKEPAAGNSEAGNKEDKEPAAKNREAGNTEDKESGSKDGEPGNKSAGSGEEDEKRPAADSGEKTEDRPDAGPREKAEKKSDAGSGEKAEDKSDAGSGEKTEDKSDAGPGEKAEKKSDTGTEEKAGDKSEAESGKTGAEKRSV